MDMILNEKEMALKSIETGYIDYKKPTNTIRTLIKYFYSNGLDKTQIRDEIENFMEKYYIDFNSASWQTTLDNMVKTYAKEKHNLIKIDSVNITNSEWNKILSINNIKLEKILFILLVYAKVLNKVNAQNNNWVNKECNVLFKAAKLTETGKQQRLILKQLGDMGYIQIPIMVNGTSVRVDFVDEQSEVIYELTDFDNIILSYLKLKGENIKMCETEGCNHLIKITNNKKKYCDECAKEIEKENHKIRQQNYIKRKNDEIENTL
jgi:hypothetical protein